MDTGRDSYWIPVGICPSIALKVQEGRFFHALLVWAVACGLIFDLIQHRLLYVSQISDKYAIPAKTKWERLCSMVVSVGFRHVMLNRMV